MTRTGLCSGRQATHVLDSLSTAVVVLDRELCVNDANPAAESLLSMSIASFQGMPLEQLIPGAPHFVAAVRGASGEGRTFSERNMNLRLPQGGSVSVDCTVSPWWEASAEPPFMVLEITNTDRHQRIQLEGSMSVQNQVTNALLQGLAHEIKNPLGGIRGAAQLLERELADQGLIEYTQIIIGETDRLRKLVDRMLTPHRATHKQPMNIHDALERVLAIVDAGLLPGVAIRRDYDPSIPELEADPDQLIQAFMNVIRNAVQAVEEMGGTITVRTRVHRKFTIRTKLHRLVACVEIIDTGPGVDREIAESIFFPMVSGRARGNGLGLPIAQSLVHRQGGLIEFSSTPGHTVFVVWLPIGTTA